MSGTGGLNDIHTCRATHAQQKLGGGAGVVALVAGDIGGQTLNNRFLALRPRMSIWCHHWSTSSCALAHTCEIACVDKKL